MPINSNVRTAYQTAEYGKFVELVNDSQFPPVSTVRWYYPDASNAFQDSSTTPVSSVEVFPKYAVLTHLTNASDISVSLSAGNLNVNLEDVENLLTDIDSNITQTALQSQSTLNNSLTTLRSIDSTSSTSQSTLNSSLTTLRSIDTTSTNSQSTLNNALTTLKNVESLLNQQLGQSGFDFISGGQTAASGPYTTIQVLSAAKISSIATSSGTVGSLVNLELPQGFSFNGPITSLTLSYGAVFAYRK